MDISRVDENLEQLEDLGFITNCPPDKNLYVLHDNVNKYCRLLNESVHDTEEEPFEAIHLNEPCGDFIAIFKSKYYEKAMEVLNAHADSVSIESGESRHW